MCGAKGNLAQTTGISQWRHPRSHRNHGGIPRLGFASSWARRARPGSMALSCISRRRITRRRRREDELPSPRSLAASGRWGNNKLFPTAGKAKRGAISSEGGACVPERCDQRHVRFWRRRSFDLGQGAGSQEFRVHAGTELLPLCPTHPGSPAIHLIRGPLPVNRVVEQQPAQKGTQAGSNGFPSTT